MSTGIRRPIYFSTHRDSDILSYIKPLLKDKSFSSVIRELVRDGIKYREQQKKPPNSYQPTQVLQSNTSDLSSSLEKIRLKEKEISKKDLETRLDSF